MSDCTHDLTEREVAVSADGMCPLCLAAALAAIEEQAKVDTDTLCRFQDRIRELQQAERDLAEARKAIEWMFGRFLGDGFDPKAGYHITYEDEDGAAMSGPWAPDRVSAVYAAIDAARKGNAPNRS